MSWQRCRQAGSRGRGWQKRSLVQAAGRRQQGQRSLEVGLGQAVNHAASLVITQPCSRTGVAADQQGQVSKPWPGHRQQQLQQLAACGPTAQATGLSAMGCTPAMGCLAESAVCSQQLTLNVLQQHGVNLGLAQQALVKQRIQLDLRSTVAAGFCSIPSDNT